MYVSDRVDGRVVDAASGRPVAGAVVVAVWRKIEVFVERWDGIYLIVETQTDAAGCFTIPRWGPRPKPNDAYLDKRDPELWVLKRGYLVGYFDNTGPKHPLAPLRDEPDAPIVLVKSPPNKIPNARRGEYARSEVAGSAWNGKVLLLERPKSDRQCARALAGASPVDPYLTAKLYPLPLFWAEWRAARGELPPELRELVDRPRSLVDIEVRPSQRPTS